MSEPLIPPNPSVSGWYWLRRRGEDEAWEWLHNCEAWHASGISDATDSDLMARLGYTFATVPPHRIPTAEELRAVHGLIGDFEALTFVDAMSADAFQDAADAFQDAADMLRAALGITPAPDLAAKEAATDAA